MTKFEATILTNESTEIPVYEGTLILDNCKFTLRQGHLVVNGKGLKLLHGSSLETSEEATIEIKQ